MGPVGHVGIPLPVAHLLKLSLPVVAFSSLLPDLVDKPLWALGIGNGRYVAHSLLFVFLVAIVFSLKNKRYGLSVLFGGMSHLLLDWPFVPWFYPFVSYDFPFPEEFSFSNLLHSNLSFSILGKELICVALIGLATLLYLWLISWFRKRAKQRAYYGSQYNRRKDEGK